MRVEGLNSKLTNVERMVVMSDQPAPRTGDLPFVGEYEALLAAASPDYDFPDFDENTQATTFYTTGTTGLAQGRLLQPSAARPACAGGVGVSRHRGECKGAFTATTSTCRSRRCSMSTPGAFPGQRRWPGVKQVYPGRYEPAMLLELIKQEGVTFTHGVPTILHMLLARRQRQKPILPA